MKIKIVKLGLAILWVSGCASNYVAPLGVETSNIHFKLNPDTKRNSIQTYEKYEDCSGLQNITFLSEARDITVPVAKGKRVSFTITQIVSTSYGWQTSQSEYCQYTFTLLAEASEYLIETYSASSCSMHVLSKNSGEFAPEEVQMREFKSREMPSSPHCTTENLRKT